MEFNKLVRDKIPAMIEANGEHPVTRILDREEYIHCLERKLDEEVGEYHRDKNVEELADILEILFALASVHGASHEELLSVCREKREKRGGFQQRIYLISKE
jgi:predicted house-cleaning noncanonical NTP pyrophosphatase (MazG superfamily)